MVSDPTRSRQLIFHVAWVTERQSLSQIVGVIPSRSGVFPDNGMRWDKYCLSRFIAFITIYRILALQALQDSALFNLPAISIAYSSIIDQITRAEYKKEPVVSEQNVTHTQNSIFTS